MKAYRFVPLLFLIACAPTKWALDPHGVGYVLSMDFPSPESRRTHRSYKRKRRIRHYRSKKKQKKLILLPDVLASSRPKRGQFKKNIVWLASLLIGIKGEFEDRPFLSYILYASDTTSIRLTHLSDCLRLLKTTTTPNPGDIVILKGCKNKTDAGVIVSVCKKGYVVISNCNGIITKRLLPSKTKSHKACRVNRTLSATISGFKSII